MTTLATFHAWFALLCDIEAELPPSERVNAESEYLVRLGSKAARKCEKLGGKWRDAMYELGADPGYQEPDDEHWLSNR